MDTRKNIPLIIGLAIPILMILFVTASIYLPGLFIKPQHSFLYSTHSYPTYYEQQGQEFIEHTYYVRNNKLIEETRSVSEDDRRWPYRSEKPQLYVYDVATDTNREVTVAEAQALSLDTRTKAPDGFTVTHGRSDAGMFPFVFWSERDYSKQYLKKDTVSKEINLRTGSGSYRDNFNFIGWIIN